MLILYAYQSKADRFAWTPAGRVFQLADVYVSHPQISVASPVMSVAAFCVLLLAFSLGVDLCWFWCRTQGCRRKRLEVFIPANNGAFQYAKFPDCRTACSDL